MYLLTLISIKIPECLPGNKIRYSNSCGMGLYHRCFISSREQLENMSKNFFLRHVTYVVGCKSMCFLFSSQRLPSKWQPTFAEAAISWIPLVAASFIIGVMRPRSVATAIEMSTDCSCRGPFPSQVTFTSGICWKKETQQDTAVKGIMAKPITKYKENLLEFMER